MEEKEKPKRGLPTRLKNTARILECNLYFLNEIDRLKKKPKITDNVLFRLRKNLQIRKIAKLSALWNPYLKIRIEAGISLMNMNVGGAPIFRINNRFTKEVHYVIEIYPEITDDDIIRALKTITRNNKRRFKKEPIQPLEDSNFKLATQIIEFYRKGLKPMDIFKQFKYVDYTTIHRIIRRSKKGFR